MSNTNDEPSSMGSQPLVVMRFRPAWAYIDGIREFGRFFCHTTFGAPELAERAMVVLQETLENAVKYSTKAPDGELELVIESDGHKIAFSVTSMPDAKHLQSLRDELTGIHALDPEKAYLAAFERASKDPDASARLGLARMRYEGGVELSLKEEANGRLRVTATGKV